MKFIKKLFEKKVDERQELELLKVERMGYWVTFWLLFASLIIQDFVMEAPTSQFAGEGIVFLISCIVLCIGCIRKGLWCYQTRKVPGVKAYLLYSLAGAAAGIILGLFTNNKFQIEELSTRILIIGITSGSIFFSCFFLFLIAGGIAKSREKKLEEKAMKEAEENEDDSELL